MVFDEVLPLYFSAPRYAGGLGADSQELAKALSLAGIQQLFCQFVLYPKINKYLPTLSMVRVALLLFLPVYIAFPELSTLQTWLDAGTAVASTTAQIWLFRLAYMSLLFVRYFANCLAFTSLMILVNNSADTSILGAVNG